MLRFSMLCAAGAFCLYIVLIVAFALAGNWIAVLLASILASLAALLVLLQIKIR